jgi:hypothetical protein
VYDVHDQRKWSCAAGLGRQSSLASRSAQRFERKLVFWGEVAHLRRVQRAAAWLGFFWNDVGLALLRQPPHHPRHPSCVAARVNNGSQANPPTPANSTVLSLIPCFNLPFDHIKVVTVLRPPPLWWRWS